MKTPTQPRKPARRIEFYRDRRREWRWRAISHGQVLAVASEGYKRRIDAAIAARVTAACLTVPAQIFPNIKPTP